MRSLFIRAWGFLLRPRRKRRRARAFMSKITHNTYINKLHQILQGHVQQLVQVHSAVSKLLESSLLLLL